jgi:hypothetical protein
MPQACTAGQEVLQNRDWVPGRLILYRSGGSPFSLLFMESTFPKRI